MLLPEPVAPSSAICWPGIGAEANAVQDVVPTDAIREPLVLLRVTPAVVKGHVLEADAPGNALGSGADFARFSSVGSVSSTSITRSAEASARADIISRLPRKSSGPMPVIKIVVEGDQLADGEPIAQDGQAAEPEHGHRSHVG